MSFLSAPPALRPLPQRVDLTQRRVVAPAEVAWETLPPHPALTAQPTLGGQRPRAFTPHAGILLVGYGDWNVNTGPVDVVGYQIDTGEPVTLLTDCPTEAFDRIVLIDGHAYLPFIDPATAENRGGFATDRGGSWSLVTLPVGSMIHVFDVARIGGRIHLCGSNYAALDESASQAVVWQEQPNGTWVQVLASAPVPVAGGAPRFYHFFLDGATVRVQNRATSPTETWYTTDGTTWVPDPAAPDLPTPSDFTPPTWPLPAGVTAYAEAGGWAWIGLPGGVVKRTRLVSRGFGHGPFGRTPFGH